MKIFVDLSLIYTTSDLAVVFFSIEKASNIQKYKHYIHHLETKRLSIHLVEVSVMI